MTQEPKISATARTFLKANWQPTLIFIAFLVLSHLEGNLAMTIGVLTFFWAVALLLKSLFYLCSWLVRRNHEKIVRLKKSSLRFVYMAILCVASWQGIAFIHYKISKDFAPLIEKLETYKTEHGEYPKTQEAFENVMPQLPKCGLVPFTYDYRSRDGNAYICSGEQPPHCFVLPPSDKLSHTERSEGYSITCMTYGFNHHTYSSESKEWHNGD